MSQPAVMVQPRSASFRTLYLTTLVLSGLSIFYGWVGLQPAPIIALSITLGPYLATLAWARRDAPLHRIALVHDWGFLALVAWPLVLPWYAIKTRGKRGVGLILLIYVLILAPSVMLNLAFFAHWGEFPQ
jgi:DMSO reductase anchor subunit